MRFHRRGVLAALLLLTLASQARAAVTYSASASAVSSSATSITLTSFNGGVGANRVLVVGLSFGQGAPAGVSVTFGGGQSFTLVPGTSGTNGNAHVELWYLVRPSATTADIVASWTGSHDVVIGAVAFANVNQASPIANGTVATGISTTPAVTVTSAAGNMTMNTAATLGTLSAPTQTQRWLATSATMQGGGSTAAGAASVTHQWTSTSAAWASAGVSIQASATTGFATGSFIKPITGAPFAQTIPHGLGQVPKAIILWTSKLPNETFAAGYWSSIGFSDGTTSKSVATSSQAAGAGVTNSSRRIANKALTIVQYGELTLAEGDLQSWDATNFVINWTTNDAATDVIHFIAIGGSDVTAKVLGWQMPTAANAAYGVTGVGFQPNVVIHAHAGSTFTGAPPLSMTNAIRGLGVMDDGLNEWANTDYAVDAVATSDTQRGQQTNGSIYAINNALAVTKKANLVSMDADGFTMNFTTADANPSQVVSLALTGVNVQAGSFLKNGSAPTFVQQNATKGGAVNTVTNLLPAVSTTGDLIVVTLGFDSAAATVSSLTDTAGNVYTLAVGPTVWGTNYHAATYYASNIVAGAVPLTITAKLTANATSFFELYALEYQGVSTGSPLDQVSAATGTGTAMNSGSQTTTQANELIYGYGAGASVTVTVGATYTARSIFDANFAADKTVAVAGSYNVTGTNGAADQWVTQMVTFKGASPIQPITGTGFQPSVVLLSSFQDVTRATPVTQSRFGFGASNGVTEGAQAFADADAVAAKSVQSVDKTSKVFVKVNNSTSTVDAQADLTSMDANGFTLNWATNDAVPTQILYLALAPLVNTEVKLIGFDAAKYARGVLLQWRTGYEIDNLGFNLYREVNGVRTKINASLVAGSGLSAGHGAAVTSVLSYARWDLDPAAATDGVVYWLEDIDFNGKRTLHGPVAPVAGTLQAPDAIATSGDLKDLGRPAKDRKVFFKHNEDVLRRTRASWTTQPQTQIDTQWVLAGQATVKIGVNAPGWYRVSQPDLVAAGLNPRVDPQTLRLFVDGTEVALRVTGEGKGRFDAGDAIEFYGTGLDTSFTDTHVYWLAAGGERGRRIETIGATGGGAGAGSAGPTSFWSTLQRKDRSNYFTSLENGDADNWFGPLVSSDPIDLTLPVDHLDRGAAGPAQVTVAVQGVTTAVDGNSGHRVGVLVNGTDVGEFTFVGQTHGEQTFAVPPALLIEGDNTVTLVARNGDVDWSLVDLVRLGYWHTYRADQDRLRFTVDQAGPVTVGGFASPSIRVVDITDPAAAVELRGVVRTAADGLSSITLGVAGPTPRTLLAFSEPTVGAPVFLRANQPSNWHAATHGHDYIVISHGDFVEQVKPLVAAREQQGYHTALVDVEDVYDEFSFGEKTPQAIRDFLSWATTTWRLAPRFVVLVGDATVDPRDYAGLGDADFVPTKQVPMLEVALETASDDWFVDFHDDGLPAIAMGRLSVRTPAQAQAMVAKIVDYDRAPLQPWTQHVLLVADAGDDDAHFEQESEDLAASLPANYAPTRVYRGVLGDDVAHQTLIDRVNDGQLVVNYTGHGSVGLWGSDGQLLTNADVPASFVNAGRLPFVVAMNCLNGFFDQVWDEESLAEAWTRAPHGGAVAVWASSSTTPSATQALVDRELFRLLFNGTYATIGEAVVAAKRVVSNQDLRRSWIFFGDPAMHLLGAPMPAVTRQTPVATPIAAPAATASTTSTASADSRANASATPDALAALDRRPDPVRLMDANGDGRADLWWYAADSGRWAAVVNGATGVSAVGTGVWDRGWQVVAADVNGDGRADFVFYKDATADWVQARAAADGTFVFTRGSLGAILPHAQLAVGDFTGDRRDDLLVYSPDSGAWVVAVSDGTGGFTAHGGTWPAGLRVHAADFNGDALTDVFAYDPITGAGLLALAKRDGSFTVSTRNWGPGWIVATANLDSHAAADLLFYAPATGAWQAAVNDGAGRFTMRGGAWPAGLELHVADFDGDGRDDVFGYDPLTGLAVIAMNTAPGQFKLTLAAWTPGWTIAVGDVNGDGRDDLALYDPTTGNWIQCLSTRAGVFVFNAGTSLPGATFVGSPR